MGNCLLTILTFFQVAKSYHISGKKLRQLRQIAQGGYGYVLLVQDIDTLKRYALKKLICQTEQQKESYHREVQIMKKLSGCKHVVAYHGSHQIKRENYLQTYILMELAEKTVFDLLSQNQKKGKIMNEAEIIKILKETVIGLKEMHDLQVFHHDVKVQNILLTQQGTAKLCDLGSCSTQKIDLQTAPKAKIYQYQEHFQKNTTLMYRPPEMIDLYQKYPVDDRVDIWMLGCVLFVLNYRFHPFQDQGKLSIVNANIKYGEGKVSKKMEDLMRHLLTPNPRFRPRIGQVLNLLQKWDELQQIPLNRVAATIKQDQIYVQLGQYQKLSKGDWRSYTV